MRLKYKKGDIVKYLKLEHFAKLNGLKLKSIHTVTEVLPEWIRVKNTRQNYWMRNDCFKKLKPCPNSGIILKD